MPDVMTPDSMVSKLDSLESKENEGTVTDEEKDVRFRHQCSATRVCVLERGDRCLWNTLRVLISSDNL